MSLLIRSWTLMLGLSSRCLSLFERRNPEALLEAERERLRKLVGRFNAGLISHATMAERLMSQVKRGEAQAEDLQARIGALLKADNRDIAARYALQFKQINARIEEDRKQLQLAEQTYHQLVATRDATIGEARTRLETLRHQIGDLKVKRALADLEDMASAMILGLGGSGDALNRLEELVGEERDKAAARLKIASSSGAPFDIGEREMEQAAYSAAALD